jgi:hypothetical protein
VRTNFFKYPYCASTPNKVVVPLLSGATGNFFETLYHVLFATFLFKEIAEIKEFSNSTFITQAAFINIAQQGNKIFSLPHFK